MEQGSLYKGKLEEIRIPEILSNLFRKKETGSLRLVRDPLEKTLYLEEGRIVFASSNDPDERLGNLLLRRSKVTYRQLLDCAPKVDPGKRLGTVLVLEGIIQPNDLYQGVIDQIKEITYSVFDWESGMFQFHSGPLPQKEVITLNLSTPDLILTGMQRIWRWSWIQKALPALDIVYRKSEGWSPVVRKMTLTREMEAILDLFDRPRTLEEVLRTSALGNFETCRLVWTFLTLSIIEEILVAPRWLEPAVEVTAPVVASEDQPAELPVPTQEMPVPSISAAEPVEGPTLKLQMEEQLTEPEKTAPVMASQDLEPLLAEPVPFSELSFSDLTELTDSEEKQNAPDIQETPALQAWETRVQPELKQFNELHRYLYEMISLELGSGASNFLSKALRKASIEYPLVFEGIVMNEFGELGESDLLANIQGNIADNYKIALDFLISEERSMISLFLEMKRVEIIEAGIKRILERRNRTLA